MQVYGAECRDDRAGLIVFQRSQRNSRLDEFSVLIDNCHGRTDMKDSSRTERALVDDAMRSEEAELVPTGRSDDDWPIIPDWSSRQAARGQ